jgi:hypothetical protein
MVGIRRRSRAGREAPFHHPQGWQAKANKGLTRSHKTGREFSPRWRIRLAGQDQEVRSPPPYLTVLDSQFAKIKY